MSVEEAERELKGVIDRLKLGEDDALYVLMQEYDRLKGLVNERR